MGYLFYTPFVEPTNTPNRQINLRRFLFAILLFSLQQAFGQRDYNPSLYFQIEQSFQAYPVLNPASISGKQNFTLNLGSQFNGGPFENTRKYYLQYAMPLTFVKGEYSHGHFGINFQQDKEGPILSRTRWNLLYSWSTKISSQWNLALGASAGQLGYYVTATNVSRGGSSNILDGHVGSWLYSKKSYFGISANQIFEGQLAPIQQTFEVSRVYHFIGGHKWDVSPNVNLEGAFIMLYDPHYDEQYDLTLLSRYHEVFFIGAVGRINRSLVMVTGLEHLHLGVFSDFSASFSYSYPLGQYAPDIRIYGIDITFEIDWVTFPKSQQ